MKEKFRNLPYRECFFYWTWGLVCAGLALFLEHVVMMDMTDYPYHLNVARNLFVPGRYHVLQGRAVQSYLLFHILTKVFHLLFGAEYELAAAILLTAATGASVLLMRWTVNDLFPMEKAWQRYLVDLICLGSVFFENLTGPLTEGRFYTLQGAPNPWHNPTVLMVKPFGILAFALFIRLLKKAFGGGQRCLRVAIAYAVVILLCAYAKPSHPFVLLPAFCAATLAGMWKKRSVRPGLVILAATLPVAALLCWQFVVCFHDSLPQWMVPRYAYSVEELDAMERAESDTQAGADQGESTGVGEPVSLQGSEGQLPDSKVDSKFGFRFGQKLGVNDPFNVIQVAGVTVAACAVPLLALFFALVRDRSLFRDPSFWIALVALLVGWVERFFFSNGPHGDFAWGYYGAIQIATVVSLAALLRSGKIRFWMKGLALCAYAYQICCGVVYCYNIYYRFAFFV